MSNLWLNIRFGTRHLKIGPDGISFSVNQYHVDNKPEKWLEVYS